MDTNSGPEGKAEIFSGSLGADYDRIEHGKEYNYDYYYHNQMSRKIGQGFSSYFHRLGPVKNFLFCKFELKKHHHGYKDQHHD